MIERVALSSGTLSRPDGTHVRRDLSSDQVVNIVDDLMALIDKLLFDSLSDDALRVPMFYAGHGEVHTAGWVHEKTVPHSIIAEATRGMYELECPDARLTTRPGEAWVTAPGMPLRITHHSDPETGALTQLRFLHFSFMLHDLMEVTRLFRMPMKLVAPQCAGIGEVIEELLRSDTPAAHKQLHWQARRQELAFRVLRILCEVAEPAPDAQLLISRAQRLKPLIEHLRANLASPITASDMAKACHMSLSGFHRQFSEYAGTSPVNYLKRLRLNEAARLLLSTDLTLAEIADRVGFTNPFHFSREFKRGYKQSPSIYRTDTYGRLQRK